MKTAAVIVSLLLTISLACDRETREDPAVEAATSRPAPNAAQQQKLPRVVFLGDSITAGYGVDADQAFPAVVTEMLARDGVPIDAVNAGTSGDTTAGGLRRLDWLLRQNPDVVVVGLGGNDGLRGQDVKSSEQNLRQIVTKSRAAGADVLLLGMMIPPNYGPEYTSAFRDIYPRVAKELNVPLVAFVLEGVGGETKLNQRDGIHPTAEGHQRVAANVAPPLREILKRRAEPSTVTR